MLHEDVRWIDILISYCSDIVAHEFLKVGECGDESDEGGTPCEPHASESQAANALPMLSAAMKDGFVSRYNPRILVRLFRCIKCETAKTWQ